MTLPLIPFVFAAYFLLYAFAYSVPSPQQLYRQNPLGERLRGGFVREETKLGPQLSLDAWLKVEEKVALRNLLRNVAPGGANALDAAPGTVIASPSKSHPDYYYQWVRDAAITTSTLVSLYARNPSQHHPLLQPLEAYASLSHTIQHTTNPSGSFADSLRGLGEPKFRVDGSPYTENWGRPQNDGPALRAITLMAYLRAYNASHPEVWTSDELGAFADLYDAALPANSTIKADLEFVSHYWREDGFDLWEEVRGLHLFTAMVQARALREGSALAAAFGDSGAATWYGAQAEQMDSFLDRFWSEDKGHLVETLGSSRSGLDCGVLLGSLHGTGDGSQKYAPYSDEMLLTLLYLVRDQRNRFPINAVPEPGAPGEDRGDAEDYDELAGVGVGRYPEDEYDGYGSHTAGGNPWFLCTSTVAEILYRTSSRLTEQKRLRVTPRASPFWHALLPDADFSACTADAPCSFDSHSDTFARAVRRLRAKADGFLAVVRRHADGVGSLSEQFDRVDGYERGATDLTWSYGAFLQAVWARGETA